MRKIFSCDEWNSYPCSKKAKGKYIVDKFYEKALWKKEDEIALLSQPLLKVPRMVDGDKATMGFIYEAMDHAKEAIRKHTRAKDKSIFLCGK